jgi:hypothetical protein
MQSYASWRRDFDEALKSGWFISIEDAGLDENDLRGRWRNGEGAVEFAREFARKYGLTHCHEVGLKASFSL